MIVHVATKARYEHDFDKTRGKINVQQSLMERIDGVKSTGLADEIIVEEYEGQKIDDIKKYDVDIFTVGSDWKGKFDYLNEYCKVVYLERTQGVSSTEIREQKRQLRMGLVGESKYLCKLLKESTYVNGLSIEAIYSDSLDDVPAELKKLKTVTDNLDVFINAVDAVYIRSFLPIGRCCYCGWDNELEKCDRCGQLVDVDVLENGLCPSCSAYIDKQ